MPGVEDDRIARRLKDAMHGECELDDAKIGTEMSAGLAHVFDQEPADLLAQLLELIFGQVP
jgi:hypothetical protein